MFLIISHSKEVISILLEFKTCLVGNEDFMKMIICWTADVYGGALPAPMDKPPLISLLISYIIN